MNQSILFLKFDFHPILFLSFFDHLNFFRQINYLIGILSSVKYSILIKDINHLICFNKRKSFFFQTNYFRWECYSNLIKFQFKMTDYSMD